MAMKSKKPKRTKHYRPPGKKKEGNAARYVTRSRAIKHLQVSLPLFRKLCILKGVFPREPKKKVRGNNQTYYHVKDTAFLQHEPLLERFREIRVYQKKIKRASAKLNEDFANRLRSREPGYTLDRLVRERYPKFVDTLRDLDDCLTMVHLFAVLPAVDRLNINVEHVHDCRRLSHEWQAYIAVTHKLRKVFISVKGIYYQAEVEGQTITWMAPHSTQQVLPDDVNFSIMLNFLEFYETLQGFVNFRLYHSINTNYPPVLDPQLEAVAADLYALLEPKASTSTKLEQVEAHKGREQDESGLRLAQLQHHLPSNGPGALMHLMKENQGEENDRDTKECMALFKNMKFFLSREVPRESLLFVITAFGGVVSWDGDMAPFKEGDQSITHQIVDRPTQGHKYLFREYVQPQWIFDCVNVRVILPTQDYVVGRIPPPHLSPFVDNEAEGYVPDYAQTIKCLQDAARNDTLPIVGIGKDDLEDPQELLANSYIIRTEAIEAAERKRNMLTLEKQYHEELKMELQGLHSSLPELKKVRQSSAEETELKEDSATDLQQIPQQPEELHKSMMTRKQRGLLEAIERNKEKKKAHISKLKERKRKLESKKSEKD